MSTVLNPRPSTAAPRIRHSGIDKDVWLEADAAIESHFETAVDLAAKGDRAGAKHWRAEGKALYFNLTGRDYNAARASRNARLARPAAGGPPTAPSRQVASQAPRPRNVAPLPSKDTDSLPEGYHLPTGTKKWRPRSGDRNEVIKKAMMKFMELPKPLPPSTPTELQEVKRYIENPGGCSMFKDDYRNKSPIFLQAEAVKILGQIHQFVQDRNWPVNTRDEPYATLGHMSELTNMYSRLAECRFYDPTSGVHRTPATRPTIWNFRRRATQHGEAQYEMISLERQAEKGVINSNSRHEAERGQMEACDIVRHLNLYSLANRSFAQR